MTVDPEAPTASGVVTGPPLVIRTATETTKVAQPVVVPPKLNPWNNAPTR